MSKKHSILYIFPHPDDESFGPATAIAQQIEAGHSVSLLTLTQGGATKMRHKLNLSIEEMGKVRAQEMKQVAKVLGLNRMTVLDLPDSGLKHLDPRVIEAVIEDEINVVKPDILVTYPVHGISGFHDHIVSHQVVKRVFCELQDQADAPRRLAFHTEDQATAEHFNQKSSIRISYSTDEEIMIRVPVQERHQEAMRQALDCYETYSQVIKNTGIRDHIPDQVVFELFQEHFDPPLSDLTYKMPQPATR